MFTENRAVRFVRETHRLETDIEHSAVEVYRLRGIGDFAVDRQQVEHALDIRQRLAQFAIYDAQEIQRHVKLDQQRVHQHQIADAHTPFDDTEGRAPHHGGDGGGDNDLLSEIEDRQGNLGASRGILPLAHGIIVTSRLVAFVAEILDSLIVEKTVDGARVGG